MAEKIEEEITVRSQEIEAANAKQRQHEHAIELQEFVKHMAQANIEALYAWNKRTASQKEGGT